MGVDDPFRVLIVCTGNVARSPMAARLLVAGLISRTAVPLDDLERQVRVRSAGTGALAGQPMAPRMAQLLVSAGGDPNGHVARQLTDQLIDDADLILTATREHRSAVVARRPLLFQSTFTLREAARLAGAADELPAEALGQRWRSLAIQLSGSRGRVPLVEAAVDDVIDPYGRRARVYAKVGAQLTAAVDALLDVVAPRPLS